MKFKKLLLICAITAIIMASFVLFTNAATIEEIQFGYNHFESVVANEDNERKDMVFKLFDGDLTSNGIYGEESSNIDEQFAWTGGIGDYVLITFPEPTVVTDMEIYVTGNWTHAIIEFFDENGEGVLLVDNDDIFANDNPYGPVGVAKPVFKPTDETQYITVSQIKLTVASLKWNGRHSTYCLSEIKIRGMHEHKYTNYDSIVTPPTCAIPGEAKYFCNCGDEALFPVDPHGQHIEGNRVVFRNGFTNPGYKATVCVNCNTMDSNITDTIGPLFSTLGYSVREDGVSGITLGFAPIYDNIEKYNELSGTTLKFGTVLGSRAVLTEGNPLNLNGEDVTPTEGIVAKDYTALGYDIISCRIAGFNSALNSTELIIAAYIYDGYNIYYLGNDTTVNVPTVSYNGLKGIVPEEE